MRKPEILEDVTYTVTGQIGHVFWRGVYLTTVLLFKQEQINLNFEKLVLAHFERRRKR